MLIWVYFMLEKYIELINMIILFKKLTVLAR